MPTYGTGHLQAKLQESQGRCLACFFYAGHGAFSEACGHVLQPSDYNSLGDGIVLEQDVLEPMMALAHHALAIVDACRVGGLRGGNAMKGHGGAAGQGAKGQGVAGFERPMQLVARAGNAARSLAAPLLVGWACGLLQEAASYMGNGVFTAALLQVPHTQQCLLAVQVCRQCAV